jgi:hypothetical protein
MAINNLEQAAMTAASTGVTPTPTRVPQYEDRPGDEWMSYVPEAYGQLPDAIKRQRQREVTELESGIPEAIRQAAQPMSRRGLYGSGLQLEDIGQAALQRQIAIDKAKTLAEIDPLKAQIAMGDLAQQRGTQRAQESRRRYEKEESYSQQQKARDDLMKQAAGSGILSTLTGRNPISDLLFGKQTSPLEQALLASVTGGKGLGTGTGASQQGGLVQKLATSIAAKTGLDKLLGLGGTQTQTQTPDYSNLNVSGAGTGIDPYQYDDPLFEDNLEEFTGQYYGDTADDYDFAMQDDAAGLGLLSGLGITESEIPELQAAFGGSDFDESDIFTLQEAFEGVDYEPFGVTFDSASLGDSEVASQAARQPSLPFKNPLDNPNLTAMNVTDTSLDYSPTGFLPSEAEMLAGEGGSMYGGEGTNILGSLGSGAKEALQGISDVVPGNILDTGLALAISSALNPEGLKGVAKNPLSFIGPQIMSQSGAGPLAIGKALATQTLPTGKALSSALTGGVIGLPMALIGMGAAKGKKDRARDEAEEMRNLSGSARYNFVPGGLWMAGNQRRSPALDEASGHFTVTDQITGLNKIYTEDPRRSVMGGDSLSKRGQDFAREAGIEYTNPDPDIQNTSQKWLGKQQVYSELVPGLKPIFMAGLKGQMPREQVEDKVAEISNSFFANNPSITGVYNLNKTIADITHQNQDDLTHVQNRITELEFQREGLKENVPEGWKHMAAFKPMPVIISIEQDDRFVESED